MQKNKGNAALKGKRLKETSETERCKNLENRHTEVSQTQEERGKRETEKK
jgi:hypothetical protein